MNKILLFFLCLFVSFGVFGQSETITTTTTTTPVANELDTPLQLKDECKKDFFNFKKESPQGIIKLGTSTYQGDVHCRTDGAIGLFQALNPSIGIGARIPFWKSVGLRADAHYIRLSGDEAQFFEDKGHTGRAWEFENNFLELTGSLDWEILGHRRFKDGKFNKTLTPVIFAGIGAAFVNPDVDFGVVGPSETLRTIDEEEGSKVQLAIPIGVGLKYYLSDAFALGVEIGLRRPVSDYYDGISATANTEQDDGYGFGGITAAFRLGKKRDRDKDGFYNCYDKCPDDPEKQVPGSCNCGKADKDTDGDGVADCKDNCPEDPNKTEPGICDCGVEESDRDNDGTPDCIDECPDDPKKIKPGTCDCGNNDYADADKDGTVDCKDGCPNDPNKTEPGKCGCGEKDSDGDGVCDKDDKCKDEAGLESLDGCPEPDEPVIVVTDRCDCFMESNSPVFQIPTNKKPKVLTRLGTNPEFGNSHGLTATGFWEKVSGKCGTSRRDRIFMDKIAKTLGYSSFSEISPNDFAEVTIPYGTTGNIGYSKSHKTTYVTLNAKLSKDLEAFKITGKNGCSVHFMKTCGNHFYFCSNSGTTY